MEKTIYDEKKYILKDLKDKHYRTIDELEDIANRARNFDIKKLKNLDNIICDFNNKLRKL